MNLLNNKIFFIIYVIHLSPHPGSLFLLYCFRIGPYVFNKNLRNVIIFVSRWWVKVSLREEINFLYD